MQNATDYYKEVRRQEALERIRNKPATETPVQVKVKTESVAPIPIKREPVKRSNSRKNKSNRSPSPRIRKDCTICGLPYTVAPSLEKRVKTCGKAECRSKQRSLSQMANNPRRQVETPCGNPGCSNILNPSWKNHSQKKYCSPACAAKHRASKNPLRFNFPFQEGDRVIVRRGKQIITGIVGGFSVSRKEKRVSVYDEDGNRVQVALSRVEAIVEG